MAVKYLVGPKGLRKGYGSDKTRNREDLSRLSEGEVQIWESLREWLPDSFASPNIDSIQRAEYLQNWQWLFTSANLHSAIRLYVKRGFVPEGCMRRHSHGLDLIIYSKFLNE